MYRVRESQEQGLLSEYSKRKSNHVGQDQQPLKVPLNPCRQALVEFVDQVFIRREFNQLIMIAGPVFLELLRATLSDRAVAVVVMQMDRSLGYHTVDEVRRHLADHLPVLT